MDRRGRILIPPQNEEKNSASNPEQSLSWLKKEEGYFWNPSFLTP